MSGEWYRVQSGARWHKEGEKLLREIGYTRTEADELAFWNLGQCGYCFRYAGKVLLIDPVLSDLQGSDGETIRNYQPPFLPGLLWADYVLCTHGHGDHMVPETLLGLLGMNPALRIVLPAGCRQAALDSGIPAENLMLLSDGADARLNAVIRVRAVSAAHPVHVLTQDDPDMALAYALDFGGIRAVHLGDTLLTEKLYVSLQRLGKISLLFAPINGNDYFRMSSDCIGNMEAEEAAKLAAALHADMSVPTHYDMVMGNMADPLRFAVRLRQLTPGAGYHIPALGERFIYRLSEED